MKAPSGCLPVLLLLAAAAALSVVNPPEELLGTGRKDLEVAEKGQSEAAKRAAAIERVKAHHARLEKLRRYSTAVDQLIDEEAAATRADKARAGILSEMGEPPVLNLVSERFAVRAEGQQKLVQIPRALSDNGQLKLRADAVFGHLGASRCGGAFLKSVSFFGNWTGKAGVLELKPGSDKPNTPMLIDTRPNFRDASVALEFGNITFHVEKRYERRASQPQRSYLDLRVSGLRHHQDVGGILGSDDHTQAEVPSAECLSAQASDAPVRTSVGSRVVVE